jgi:peptide/nickel transport system ATP-binding protein
MQAQTHPILSVRNLTTCFRTDSGLVTAVDDVSFDLAPGETLAIVGESGCGKTVTSKSIMRLLPERNSIIRPTSQILYRSPDRKRQDELPPQIDIAKASEGTMRKVRGARIAMIFQEPMTSLNPVFRIGWQIDEALKYHTTLGRSERRQRAIEMLKLVEIPSPEKRIDEYPHQLSGGMRQRVMIAIALCCEPDILIADEPTTALDVTIQAQILDLMAGLKTKLNTAILLITHNLGVVAQFCDRVMVMYAGRVIESAPVRDIFHRPQHPYTRALLDSIPKAGRREHGKKLPTIEGIVPSLFNLPKGCRFADRCGHRTPVCEQVEPDLIAGDDGRQLRCHHPITTPRIVRKPAAAQDTAISGQNHEPKTDPSPAQRPAAEVPELRPRM